MSEQISLFEYGSMVAHCEHENPILRKKFRQSEFTNPIAKNVDPETSHIAADKARRKFQRGNALTVLDYLNTYYHHFGEAPTSRELYFKYKSALNHCGIKNEYEVARRLSDMKNTLVIQLEKRKCKSTGNPMVTWKPVPQTKGEENV